MTIKIKTKKSHWIKKDKKSVTFDPKTIMKETSEVDNTKSEEKLKYNKNLQTIAAKRLHDSPIFWIMLAVSRIYLATVQTGYIHPDEFHQSLQVMAYDLLDIDAAKPWEYTTSAPVRSVVFLGLVSFPVFILKTLAPLFQFVFSVNILSPYALILIPRLFMTALSFIADFCVYKIASRCYVRPWQCLEVFASSYVMLVYATRTFSNSLELIFQAILLWRVCVSIVDSTKVIRRDNVLQDLYESVDTMKDKVKIARTKSKLPHYNYRDSFLISVIVTAGVFVRPTFFVYSFIPVTYWLQRGVVTKELSFTYFNWRCISLLPGTFLTFFICVLADSFYHGSITLVELLNWNVTASSFTVTPLNFITYNTNSSSLQQHGLHPYLLHVGVNIPLLFGVLGIVGMWSVSKYMSHFIFRDFSKKPKVYSLATMLLATFLIPILALSFIPHQEPRFLLPSLLPLVLLNSDKVSIYALQKFKFTKHFLFLMWQVWNICCVAFYGFLHQGGVTKTMLFLHDYVASHSPSMNYHIYFSHMYRPPTFLLMQKIPVVSSTEDGRLFKVERIVTTYDLESASSIEDIYSKINITQTQHQSATVLLCIAAVMSDEVYRYLPDNASIEHVTRISGHLSMEHIPNLIIDKNKVTNKCNEICLVQKKIKEFSIDIYKINLFPQNDFVFDEDFNEGGGVIDSNGDHNRTDEDLPRKDFQEDTVEDFKDFDIEDDFEDVPHHKRQEL